jgi:hypothetical protein
MFGSLCNNSATATLTLADTLMNDSEKRILSAKDWPFLWKQYTVNTIASQQSYTLPPYTQKPQSVYVTVGSYKYSPTEISNRIEWDKLNQVSVTSDIPTFYFVYDNQIQLFPKPATSSNVISFNGRRYGKDLSRADYSAGTITSIANGASAVVGSGTTWTSAMVGRFIQITGTDAANTGDNFWYEISAVGSNTTLTLRNTYGGTSISAGSANYTIGEVSLIPEPHNQLPVFEALKIYFTSVDPNPAKAQLYGKMFEEGYGMMFKDYGSKAQVVVDDGSGNIPTINPNLTISY